MTDEKLDQANRLDAQIKTAKKKIQYLVDESEKNGRSIRVNNTDYHGSHVPAVYKMLIDAQKELLANLEHSFSLI
jgi:hypothetical protein